MFSRKLTFKVFFDKNQKQEITQPPLNLLWNEMTINDIKTLDDLMGIWEEDHTNESESILVEEPLSQVECVTPADAPSAQIFPKEYKPKSQTLLALQTNPNIWASTHQVTNEINQRKWRGIFHSNLSPDQQEAIRSLQQNPNIVIKPLDKGGYLAVMDCVQYENMVIDLLENREWYKKGIQGLRSKY